MHQLYDQYTIRDLRDIRTAVEALGWAQNTDRQMRDAGGQTMVSALSVIEHHTKDLDADRRARALGAIAYLMVISPGATLVEITGGVADAIVRRLTEAGQLPDDV